MLLHLLMFITIFTSLMIMTTSNIIYALFFLILTALNIIILFLFLGREFVAFVFLIVYVGAICILFLFVVMMLNIQLTERTETKYSYFPLALITGSLFFFTFYIIFNSLDTNVFSNYLINFNDLSLYSDFLTNKNSEIIVISELLYEYYCFSFIISGLILLIAMIGAITLSLDLDKANIKVFKKQEIFSQLSKDLSVSVRLFNYKK